MFSGSGCVVPQCEQQPNNCARSPTTWKYRPSHLLHRVILSIESSLAPNHPTLSRKLEFTILFILTTYQLYRKLWKEDGIMEGSNIAWKKVCSEYSTALHLAKYLFSRENWENRLVKRTTSSLLEHCLNIFVKWSRVKAVKSCPLFVGFHRSSQQKYLCIVFQRTIDLHLPQLLYSCVKFAAPGEILSYPPPVSGTD